MTTGIKSDPFAVAIVGDQNSDQAKSLERIRGSTRRAVGACRVQLVIVGICLGTCGYALAQAASTGPDEVGIGIEEITVVSSKKAADELLRETPAAITAFDENRIELALAEDLPDIGRLVPNASLHLASTFTGFPNFYIRGIGVGGSTRTVDPAVGIFVDGMYIGYGAAASLETFDLASLEVLRGPQGTLLGRNVTGGAIVAHSKGPTGEMGAEVQITVGDYHRFDLAASAETPRLGDVLAVRLAVLSRRRDGYWQDNNGGTFAGPFAQPDNPRGSKPDMDMISVRPSLSLKLAEAAELVLRAQYTKDTGGSAAGRNLVNPHDPKTAQTVYGYREPTGAFEINNDVGGKNDIETWQVIGEIDWDVGHGLVTSVTGYRDVRFDTSSDFDGTPFTIFHFPQNEEDQHQLSTEFRYASSFSETVEFVAGVSHFDQSYRIGERRAILAGVEDIDQAAVIDMEHTMSAVFAQGTYQLSEAVGMVLGGRYSTENKAIVFSPPGNCALDFSSCTMHIDASDDWQHFEPKVGAQVDLNDTTMTYASWTRGFRSGTYNSRAQRPATIGPADEETVAAWEVGIKSALWNGRVQANVAAFLSDYADIQQVVANPLVGSGNEQVVLNAADATISGFEAELSMKPSASVTLESSVGLTEARYDEFRNFDADNDGVYQPSVDDVLARNLNFAQVPRWTAYLAAQYERSSAVFGGARLMLRASYAWRDRAHGDVRNDPFLIHDAYGLLDLSATLWLRGEALRVTAFGKNLTGARYFDLGGHIGALTTVAVGGTPRTWGMRLSWDYQ